MAAQDTDLDGAAADPVMTFESEEIAEENRITLKVFFFSSFFFFFFLSFHFSPLIDFFFFIQHSNLIENRFELETRSSEMMTLLRFKFGRAWFFSFFSSFFFDFELK